MADAGGGGGGPVNFNCSTCDTPIPFNHPSWRRRSGTETFCNTCRKVTYHYNPLLSGGGGQGASPGGGVTLPIDALWQDFVQKLSSLEMKPEDLAGATTGTMHEVMRQLQYDPLSSARIQTELQHKTMPQPSPKVPAPGTPVPGEIPSDAPPTPPPDGVAGTPLNPAEPIATADGTTSVDADLQDDDVMRATQRVMEKEMQKMDEELEKLRTQIAKTTERKKEEDDSGQSKRSDDTPDAQPPPRAPGQLDIPVPYPELPERVPPELWPVLVERLAACGLSEADVQSCTALTFEKVLLYLSFNPLERARLLQEFTARHGANLAATAPQPPQLEPPPKLPIGLHEPPHELDVEVTPDLREPTTGATPSTRVQTQTNLRNEPLLVDPSTLHRSNWRNSRWEKPGSSIAQPPSESNFDDEAFLEPGVKCAAHPERDIEFWCVECEALVCSICHITGFHKDHPFMSIGEAAAKEVAGLADWQMRSATMNAKLMDTKVSLEEVHQNIDDYHQQQIDTICDTVENLKAQLDQHKENLKNRVLGHAAAQHELFRPVEERIRGLHGLISSSLNKLDVLLTAKPDSMSPEDSRRWAQGVMKIRSSIGTTFQEAVNHPLVIPNYNSLKFNNEVSHEDLFAKAFLTKVPTPVGMPSYLEMRDLAHPYFAVKDRINFTWATPEGHEGTKSPIVLSNNLLTSNYSGTGSGHALFKATATFEAGRHYWEVRIDAMHNDNRLGTHVIVGLVSEGSGSMGSPTGLAWCVDKLSGMVPMALECPPWTPGSLLGIFLDLEMNRVGLYYNKQCVCHVAIPPGRYTPAACIHCSHDQVTLIPVADIPPGVSLTAGALGQGAHRLPVPKGQYDSIRHVSLSSVPLQNELDPEISYLQEECLKLRQSVNEAKREIVEQQRVVAQQNFQEQQITDLKGRIDETAALMARQALGFEKSAAQDLRKLQQFQRSQLEEETKRTWQMQAETATRANQVKAASEQQQQQATRLERFLREQQVQITQQMLEKQHAEQERQLRDRERLHQQSLLQQQQSQHQLAQQQIAAATAAAQKRQTSPLRVSPPRSALRGPSPLSMQRRPPLPSKDSTAGLREFIDMAGRFT